MRQCVTVSCKLKKSNKVNKVSKLGTLLEVSTKFENINSLLFSVLLLRILLETISNRELEIPFVCCYRRFSQNSEYCNQLYKCHIMKIKNYTNKVV